MTYPQIYLYRRIVQAKLYMDSNYQEAIDLHAIADQAYFSRYHFIRLFSKIYGKTPHQYLTGVRMEKAKLLLQTDLPVQQVCFAVGFDSIGSFTSLFKRYTAATPAQYRTQQLQRADEMGKVPLKFIPNCFAQSNGWVDK
ncbi:MAG: AraC family transcriptional regulator [Bacteroidota bacterium]